MSIDIIQGDARTVLEGLPAASVDAVVTSPPYAAQRDGFYAGVSEADYPAWTVAWMGQARRVLRPAGSVLIAIREHVRDGEMSDYVHCTRLALRADGWTECDELIWVKPCAPPVGHPGRPRRSWERLLWFAPSAQPWCDPRANGQPSQRVGMQPKALRPAPSLWINGLSTAYAPGTARSTDYACVGVGGTQRRSAHPAAFPVELATWMIRLICPEGGRVLDPFCGSGATLLAAKRLGRTALGIDLECAYVALSQKRVDSSPYPLFSAASSTTGAAR